MNIMSMGKLSEVERRRILDELSKEDYEAYGTMKMGEIRGQLIVRIPQRVKRQLQLKKGEVVEMNADKKERLIILKVL